MLSSSQDLAAAPKHLEVAAKVYRNNPPGADQRNSFVVSVVESTDVVVAGVVVLPFP